MGHLFLEALHVSVLIIFAGSLLVIMFLVPFAIASETFAQRFLVPACHCRLNVLAVAAEQRMRDFNWQELANTAWAFATLGHKEE